MRDPFVIDGRFHVFPEKNTLIDKHKNEETRLEKRLLDVLLLLVASPKKLVLREDIIHQVWGDYGGADEGLTQAVSFLRKVLDDRGKKMIETIPKKGYLFNGHVSIGGSSKVAKKTKGKYVVFAVLVIVLMAMAFLFFSKAGENDTVSPDVLPKSQKK